MQNSKYLVANERDAQWGLTVSTVGMDELAVGDSYPTRGHADGYFFDMRHNGNTHQAFVILNIFCHIRLL